MRRHNPAFQKKEEEEEVKPVEKIEEVKEEKGKKAPVVRGLKGKAAPKAPEKTAEQKAAEEAEAEEASRKASAIAKRKAEELAREAYRPKDFTDEEKAAWEKYVEELHNFFGEIIIRQMSSDEAVEKPADVEGQEEVKSHHSEEEAAASQKADSEAPVAEPIKYGKRIIREQPIEYDFSFMCENVCQIVPEPLWPDPDKEPLPPPTINSIQKKPPTRAERAPVKNFSIWTPLPADQAPPAEDEDEKASQ